MATEMLHKFDSVCQILDKYDKDSRKLIPILQEVQEEYGYLPEEVMNYVASALGITTAKIHGVATFYAHFTQQHKGKHIIKICDGTACHVKKSTDILERIQNELGLSKDKDITDDRLFSLETVACLGACGLAPAVVIDDKVHGLMTPDSTMEIINAIKEAELND